MLDDPRMRCAACKTQMDAPRFFICRACLEKLSAPARHKVMNAPNGQEAIAARRDALKELGAQDVNDVRVPPPQLAAGGCACPPSTFYFEQRNLISGEIDRVCDGCGKIRYTAKEMVKR